VKVERLGDGKILRWEGGKMERWEGEKIGRREDRKVGREDGGKRRWEEKMGRWLDGEMGRCEHGGEIKSNGIWNMRKEQATTKTRNTGHGTRNQKQETRNKKQETRNKTHGRWKMEDGTTNKWHHGIMHHGNTAKWRMRKCGNEEMGGNEEMRK
jgi:hypothetical protein